MASLHMKCDNVRLHQNGLLSMQASFDPPGLSIAVKKDRAVETLLVMGNKFNVNVLAQGNEKVCAWEQPPCYCCLT